MGKAHGSLRREVRGKVQNGVMICRAWGSTRNQAEPAAEHGRVRRPELADQPRNLAPGGALGCSNVFHNIIVP